MENKQTGVTPRELEDADPVQFQRLVENVWGVFEKQVCEQEEATRMLKTAAATMASIGNYKNIERDFNLGLLGEYVGSNEEMLPFLTSVMSHIHNQLERELQTSASQTGRTHCAMTTFLEELQRKFGANKQTKNVVKEITEMATLAAGNLAFENPKFSLQLLEIGDTIRASWKSLREEVEKCIHYARKKKDRKHLKHIYRRMICKGMHSAKTIQDKIASVSAAMEAETVSKDQPAQPAKEKSPKKKKPAYLTIVP